MLEGTTTTNFIGYNQPVGLSLSNGTTTTNFDWSGYIHSTPNSGGSYTTLEVKNGASLELTVAKHLDKDFDASKTVIRELQTIQF